MSAQFTLSPVDIALPPGAFAGGGRDVLRFGGMPVCGFTRGRFRPSLHPVWTPAGHVVTAEQPADHPHHRGIWCASDHIGLLMQGPDGIERYEYCFYVDEVFQGRAPGQIRQTALNLLSQTDNTVLIAQQLDWIGPEEWGAPQGRHILRERRWTGVTVTEHVLILDITSDITPGGDVAVAIGPTRHAWFNARLADAIAITPGSAPVGDTGSRGAAAIPSRGTAWVTYAGPVGGGAVAGITVQPRAAQGSAWFVADWGVITVGHVRDRGLTLEPGQSARFGCRIIAHDGGLPDVAALDGLRFVAPDDTTEFSYEGNGS